MQAGCLTAVMAMTSLAACADSGAQQPTASATVEDRPALEPWFDAAAQADDEAANVVVLGDSVTEGFGLTGDLQRRWLDRVQRGLRKESGASGCPTGAAGFHGTTSVVPPRYRAPSLPDPTLEGRVTRAREHGPGGRAVDLAPGASVTWRVEARSVDVGYLTQEDGGRLEISIDEQEPPDGAELSTDAEDEGGRTTWSSGDLGRGTHVITARNASPEESKAEVTVTDLMPYRGDRGRCVHVLDASRSGVSLHTITETPTYVADSLAHDPDLLVVGLGLNDAARGIEPKAFGSDLDDLIGQVRSAGHDMPILLVGWYTPDWPVAWESYLKQMRQATEHEGVGFVDLSSALPPVEDAPAGVYIDGVHPGVEGHRMIAEALLPTLTPDGG